MPNNIFLMDHGMGHTSVLYRQEIKRFGRSDMVWRETKPGEPHPRRWPEFADENGRPVDTFGLPLFGKFVEVSVKEC